MMSNRPPDQHTEDKHASSIDGLHLSAFLYQHSEHNHQLTSTNIRHTVFKKNIDIIILLSQDVSKQSTLVMHPKQRWVSYALQHIQGVPGGMCQTSGGCSLC